MDLKPRNHGQVRVISPAGRFDAHVSPVVGEWLIAAAQEPPAQVVVDLSGAHFVDSSACAVLVRGLKHCREQGGDLRLCGLQAPVRVIFELTRLDRAFEIFATEAEAVQAFAG